MNTTLYILVFASFFFSACSTVKKTSAGAAIPFAAIGDTLVAPFQLIGDCSTPLINMGDDHYMEKYDENKHKTTLMFATATSWVYYFPGYFCLPFDVSTPDNYYPMTKACVDTISSDEKNDKPKKIKARYRKTPPREDFKEW